MTEYDFLHLSIENWLLSGGLFVAFALLTLKLTNRIALGGIFDPITLVFVGNYSVNYAVVALLYLKGEMDFFYLAMTFFYGLTLIVALRFSSNPAIRSSMITYISAMTPKRMGIAAFKISIICYSGLSIIVISRMGLGVLVEENRFEAARGLGVFIRIMDSLSPFIVGFWTVLISEKTRRRMPSIIALILFVIFVSMVNGAKISMIYLFITALLALRMAKFRFSLPPIKTALAMAAGMGFVLFALNMNLVRNEVEQQEDSPLAGTSLVLERFIFRLIASGNTSYLLLPNGSIENIETDNALVRFVAPLVGSGNMSAILGYNVTNFSVGRQALLYYDPGNDVAGGPTSHYDLFAYAYFGIVGGLFFIFIMGYFLGAINRCIWLVRRQSEVQINPFRIAFVAALWSRAVPMFVEPEVGFAYVVDLLVIYTTISLFLSSSARNTVPGSEIMRRETVDRLRERAFR